MTQRHVVGHIISAVMFDRGAPGAPGEMKDAAVVRVLSRQQHEPTRVTDGSGIGRCKMNALLSQLIQLGSVMGRMAVDSQFVRTDIIG